MPYFLSKLLPLLLMPVPVVVGCALLAWILLVSGRRKSAIGILLAAIVTLWALSLPPVSRTMMGSLQMQYPPVPLPAVPASDCIIVLGGALGDLAYPRVEVELTDAIDRVYQTAKLYRMDKGRHIIVAAGNQPWSRNLKPEAQLIRELLIEWGVAPEAIELDTGSKNTHENAVNGAELVRKLQCQSNLLVTSAWHMPRAVATFAKAGVAVVPVSVDIQSGGGMGGSFFDWVPQADALAASTRAIHEWIGIWVYRWRGWN